MNTLKPYWDPFTLSLSALCVEDMGVRDSESQENKYKMHDPICVEIRFQVVDWDFTPPNDFIGEVKVRSVKAPPCL